MAAVRLIAGVDNILTWFSEKIRRL